MTNQTTTQQSGVNQAGRIILTALEAIKSEVTADLTAAGITVYSADQSVDRHNPLSPATNLNFNGEFEITDYEIAKAKAAEYGYGLGLSHSGYDENNEPKTAWFHISIMTMQH